MKITIKTPIKLRDVPVGETFRRISDNKFFIRTDGVGSRYDVLLETIPTYVCVEVPGFKIHNVRIDNDVHIINSELILGG